jgi:hypothetical protein
MSDEIEGKQVTTLKKGEKVGMDLDLYGGRVMPKSFGQVVEFAQMMCKGGVAVPKHLRDQPGACLRIIQQAMAWEMDPWGVASKSYAVNEVLAYEGQLIIAVIKKWAPVKEKVWRPIYEGEGADRKCTITVHHAESGEEITYKSPIIGKNLGTEVKAPGPAYVGIWPKNSPLWVSEPDQQLYYYSMRAMARRYFPEILLGVYDRDEVLAMRDITPKEAPVNFLDDEPAVEGEVIPPVAMGKPLDQKTVKAGDEVLFDEVTGEIYPDKPVPVPAEIIKTNLLKYIGRETDVVILQEWQNLNHAAINELPKADMAEVRKALSDRYAELEI